MVEMGHKTKPFCTWLLRLESGWFYISNFVSKSLAPKSLSITSHKPAQPGWSPKCLFWWGKGSEGASVPGMVFVPFPCVTPREGETDEGGLLSTSLGCQSC